MGKLWEKGYTLNTLVEAFTVGNDHLLDQNLIQYDCMGSIAHAAMLQKIGVINDVEFKQLHQALIEVMHSHTFTISVDEEDVHTAVENYITQKLGEVGKKLHTARSRNDQVNVDLRLFSKHTLQAVVEQVISCAGALLAFAKTHQQIPIVGRTHMQPAMPSSWGLWAGAYLESFVDDLFILQSVYALIDQSPLGSASSYGVGLPIDRAYTADLLGFKKVQNNVLYANQSRGKFEAAILHGLSQIMNDLSRLASDLIFFSLPEIGYVSVDETFCSGSSLMPQKRNPCALELIRAKASKVSCYLHQLFEILRPLPCGYQRDLQETKEPLIQGFHITQGALGVMSELITILKVNEEACEKGFTQEVFATDYVLQLVNEGISFREAYRQVAVGLEKVPVPSATENILAKTHRGATGNLNLLGSQSDIKEYARWLDEEKNQWNQMIHNLEVKQ